MWFTRIQTISMGFFKIVLYNMQVVCVSVLIIIHKTDFMISSLKLKKKIQKNAIFKCVCLPQSFHFLLPS